MEKENENERHGTDSTVPTGVASIKRRGLVAGAAALVVGLLAKQSTEVTEAAGQTMLTDTLNLITATTGVTGSVATSAWRVLNFYTGGIDNFGDAMQGYGQTSGASPVSGVYGRNNDTAGIGVQGTAPSGSGVFGDTAAGYGVYGSSTSGFGVYGISGTKGTATGNPGVYGTGPQFGVQGISAGIGVYGATSGTGSYGVLGNAFGPSSIAVAGSTSADGASAFSGGTTNANAYAAYFQGHVVVAGPFDVLGMGNKHGVAPHPDGSHRTFYAVESPECWVEDFGEGTLTNGKASIDLDADFAALAHTDKYHVFITTHNDHHLHVSEQRASGFTVNADMALATLKGKKAGDLTGTFSYRVVARPKTTAKVDRLAKVNLPNLPIPEMPKKP